MRYHYKMEKNDDVRLPHKQKEVVSFPGRKQSPLAKLMSCVHSWMCHLGQEMERSLFPGLSSMSAFGLAVEAGLDRKEVSVVNQKTCRTETRHLQWILCWERHLATLRHKSPMQKGNNNGTFFKWWQHLYSQVSWVTDWLSVSPSHFHWLTMVKVNKAIVPWCLQYHTCENVGCWNWKGLWKTVLPVFLISGKVILVHF